MFGTHCHTPNSLPTEPSAEPAELPKDAPRAREFMALFAPDLFKQ